MADEINKVITNGVAFTDGPGVSVTEVYNGYIVRWSASNVEELLELKVRYKNVYAWPVATSPDKPHEVKEATSGT